MQERYTKQAENVLALAKEAASSCGHSYIGTEHLLVGLVEEKEGTAGRVLEEFGIQADKAIALIDKLIAPPGNTAVSQRPGFSPRTRRVLRVHMQKQNPCVLRKSGQNIFCWQC